MLAILLGCAAWGQEFEAVSVKVNHTMSNSSSTHSSKGQLTAENTTLKNLMLMAYNVKDYQVQGPDWITLERYDVAAKLPAGMPESREEYGNAFRLMLQKMLAERFKLVFHSEQRSFPVYGLVVAKGGIKMKESSAAGSSSRSQNRHLEATGLSMDNLAAFLSSNMDLPVIDMTGLKGRFDFKLDWVAETADAGSGAVLPIAIQEQLGLKFESKKTPLDVLIVDRAEKLPVEN